MGNKSTKLEKGVGREVKNAIKTLNLNTAEDRVNTGENQKHSEEEKSNVININPNSTNSNSNGTNQNKDNTLHTKNNISENIFNTEKNHESEKLYNRISLKTTGGSLFEDIRRTYKFKEVLGGGHFGTVRIAYKRSEEPRKFYGVKSISKKNLSEKDLEDFMKEVEILSSLDHPNIIKFYETYHDQFYFHIVMELCKGKEVFDRIIEEGHLNEQKVANIVYKVLSAISYCHAKGITHRDLKPENILFESPEPDAEIKLIDFGLSRKYNSHEKMHTILGTPYYVAPEVLKGEYDEKCDIWSIGAISYIMLSGDPPFNGNSNNDIFNKIMNEELSFNKEKWINISKEARDFIKKCMTKTPDKRLSASKMIEHTWFKNILSEIHKEDNFSADILENLRNFSSPQKLKKMVLKFLVNLLSQKELKKLRQAFYAIDLDHTGYINIEELDKAFKLAGISLSKEELQNIINSADDQNNGKLDYSEFIVASINQKKFVDKEKLISAFKYFDVDDSGYIDAGDLKNALLRSGKKIINNEGVDKMIEEVADKNQLKISLIEFLNLFGMKMEG